VLSIRQKECQKSLGYALNIGVRYLSKNTINMWNGQKIPKTQTQYLVKRTNIKPNLVTFKLPPLCTYIFAPVVQPLIETPMEILFWYGSETCCHILLNFFYGSWGRTEQGGCERTNFMHTDAALTNPITEHFCTGSYKMSIMYATCSIVTHLSDITIV
jgi:hypothetical protein